MMKLAASMLGLAAASPFTDSMAGKLMDTKRMNFDHNELLGKTVLIYYSAHWCPPCRGFTPKLVEWYNNAKKEGKQIEIIFASSDQDEASFEKYYNDMPWTALKFSERATKEDLGQKHGVEGIPMLVVVAPDGSIEAKDGRALVGNGVTAFDSCSTH